MTAAPQELAPRQRRKRLATVWRSVKRFFF